MDKKKYIYHPFLGMIFYNYRNDKLCTIVSNKCNTLNDELKNSLSSPIKSENYLSQYFNINNLEEFVSFITKHKLSQTMLNRLLKYMFITYNDILLSNINIWFEIMNVIINYKSDILYDNMDNNKSLRILRSILDTYNFKSDNDYQINLIKIIKNIYIY